MLLFIGNLQGFAQMAMPDTVCIGATKNYSVNDATVPSTYTWKIDGVIQASIKNDISVTWRTVGIFQITVQEHGAGGCDGDIQSGMVYVGNGKRTDTTATACNSFTWNRNGQTYTSNGKYDFISVSAGGCADTLTLNLTLNPLPSASISGSGSICVGESKSLDINLTGNAPWSITYSDGTSTFTVNSITTALFKLIVSPIVNTTYSLINVSDANCANAVTGSANINVKPAVPFVRYTTLNSVANVGKALQARSFTPTDSYTWNPAIGLNNFSISNPVFKYDKTVEYLITIKPGTGCIVIDTQLVVISSPIPTNQFSDVFIPQAFSPNGDGHNDKLTPLLLKIKDLKYFRIYNRWGQIVYETNIAGEGWDGIFKGLKVGADVFTWTIEATGTDGRTHSKRGTSVLLK